MGGGRSPKNFFRPFGPPFGVNIRGALSPVSATAWLKPTVKVSSIDCFFLSNIIAHIYLITRSTGYGFWNISLFHLTLLEFLTNPTPTSLITEYKHIIRSKYWTAKWISRCGFPTPGTGFSNALSVELAFWNPKPRIPDSTSSNFWNSEIIARGKDSAFETEWKMFSAI